MAERYKSIDKYRKAVASAIDDLVRERFVLCEDAGAMLTRLVQAGPDAGIPDDGTKPPKNALSECR